MSSPFFISLESSPPAPSVILTFAHWLRLVTLHVFTTHCTPPENSSTQGTPNRPMRFGLRVSTCKKARHLPMPHSKKRIGGTGGGFCKESAGRIHLLKRTTAMCTSSNPTLIPPACTSAMLPYVLRPPIQCRRLHLFGFLIFFFNNFKKNIKKNIDVRG